MMGTDSGASSTPASSLPGSSTSLLSSLLSISTSAFSTSGAPSATPTIVPSAIIPTESTAPSVSFSVPMNTLTPPSETSAPPPALTGSSTSQPPTTATISQLPEPTLPAHQTPPPDRSTINRALRIGLSLGLPFLIGLSCFCLRRRRPSGEENRRQELHGLGTRQGLHELDGDRGAHKLIDRRAVCPITKAGVLGIGERAPGVKGIRRRFFESS